MIVTFYSVLFLVQVFIMFYITENIIVVICYIIFDSYRYVLLCHSIRSQETKFSVVMRFILIFFINNME